MRKKLISLGLIAAMAGTMLAGCGGGDSNADAAANFPEKQLTIVCPFGAGGGSDVVLRTVVPYLEEEFGQTVVIDYKEGAGGIAGVNEYTAMNPDGYTLVTYNDPHIFLQTEFQETAYEKDDLTPLMGISQKAEALFVKADSPFNTLEEWIAYAKEHPGELTVGNTGTYSSNHLSFAMISNATDIEMTRIVFENGNKSFTALLGDETDACIASIDWLTTHEGSVKALAVAAEETVAEAPEVPTFKELGYDVVSAVNNNLYVLSDTPDEVVAVLQEKIANVCESEELAADLAAAGVPAALYNAEELEAYEADLGQRLEEVKHLLVEE
ncbi:MAG: tripartite tricarboxylate transporter substrate binding protein [Peptococcaceae bacterium]|nr:tripartite tricarboxylate transporter substrate binding protein [Peptococcaceae bacterium]